MAQQIALNMDCMEYMRTLPDDSVDVVVADPPYNIGKAEWDKWDTRGGYLRDVGAWLREFSRVVKPTGSVWMFHSDMSQLAPIMADSLTLSGLVFSDFVILYKRNFRAKSWKTADISSNAGLRSLFPVCEYLVHWFESPGSGTKDKTGLERIYSTPECFRELKDWYADRMAALGLTDKDILAAYRNGTGRSGAMLRHYFRDSQFAIPTADVWTAVFEPLGFGSYEELRASYEELRASYEELRPYWKTDNEHCNVWEFNGGLATPDGAFHPTSKPVSLYERVLKISCPPCGCVLDPFLGSGSSRIAAYNLNLDFVGCEIDKQYFDKQEERFAQHTAQLSLFTE